MTYVFPERSVSVDSYTHNGNLFDPTKQYVCIRVWLPEGAPMKFLAESWNEGKEPDIENRPPYGRRAWRNWLRSQRKHDKGSWAASLGVVRGRAAFARRHRGSSTGHGIPEVPGMPPVRHV